jgi:hypothetical protein
MLAKVQGWPHIIGGIRMPRGVAVGAFAVIVFRAAQA